MKRNFVMPTITAAIFETENVLTTSGSITNTETYKETMNKIVGADGLVGDASKVITFTY